MNHYNPGVYACMRENVCPCVRKRAYLRERAYASVRACVRACAYGLRGSPCLRACVLVRECISDIPKSGYYTFMDERLSKFRYLNSVED